MAYDMASFGKLNPVIFLLAWVKTSFGKLNNVIFLLALVKISLSWILAKSLFNKFPRHPWLVSTTESLAQHCLEHLWLNLVLICFNFVLCKTSWPQFRHV